MGPVPRYRLRGPAVNPLAPTFSRVRLRSVGSSAACTVRAGRIAKIPPPGTGSAPPRMMAGTMANSRHGPAGCKPGGETTNKAIGFSGGSPPLLKPF